MKNLFVSLAAIALLAIPGCKDEALVPAIPDATPRLAILASSTTGNITGYVTDMESGRGIASAHVWFFDASNAEVLGEQFTASDGSYDSGALPIGDSRVRFSGGIGGSGWYPPVFYGASGADDFCQGSAVTVVSSTTTEASQSLKSREPSKVVTTDGGFRGTVVDGETGDPVQGIQVDFRDAATGLVVATTITDMDGNFALRLEGVVSRSVRVRFSDPSLSYLPQYDGASGLDVFCDATAREVALGGGVGASLVRVPPASLTEALLETVDSFGLPDSDGTLLVTPLTRLVVVLSDGNSANDAAACGELRGFLSRIDVQERRGVLTTEEADALRAQTANLQQALGCG